MTEGSSLDLFDKHSITMTSFNDWRRRPPAAWADRDPAPVSGLPGRSA